VKIKFHPNAKPEAWVNETNLERIVWCVKMLDVHGFITDRERAWILKRVKAWRDKEIS